MDGAGDMAWNEGLWIEQWSTIIDHINNDAPVVWGGQDSEWGRAGDMVVVNKHIDDDVAVALGVSCSMEDWGINWGEPGGAEGCGGHHCRMWSWWGCSVKCTTCSDKHIHTNSCHGVCCAVDSVGASSLGW